MEFDVVTADDLPSLVALVNARLKDGWEPRGGLGWNGDRQVYFWGVVKHEK